MKSSSLFIPLFLIIVGALWLLRSLDLFPATTLIFAFVLMAAGILIILLDGINKQSIVSGPLLIYIGLAIYAVHQYHYRIDVFFALGMMVLGVLLLIARTDAIPHKHGKALSVSNHQKNLNNANNNNANNPNHHS